MTRLTGPGAGRLSRRSLLLLAAASVTGASAAPRSDVPAVMLPMPARPATPREAVQLRPISHWTDIYLDAWDYSDRNDRPAARSGDSWEHYELSYSVDAAVAMFRATDEARYLDRALELVETVVETAKPSTELPGSAFSDGFRGWASMRPDLENRGDEIPLYESYFWRYGVSVLAAIKQHPAVYDDSAYRDRYQRLLAFVEVDVFEKWFSRGPDDYVYRERTHMASHWALIAQYLSGLTEEPARRDRYAQVIATIDKRLHGQLRRNPAESTAYFWSDVWGSARRPGQDVSHANAVMAYVTEARDRGGGWSAADVAAFGALLTEVIWPDGTTYRAYVDGTGADNGWFSDGFVKLGRYDPAIQRRLDDHRVVNDQFAANMALNARILTS